MSGLTQMWRAMALLGVVCALILIVATVAPAAFEAVKRQWRRATWRRKVAALLFMTIACVCGADKVPVVPTPDEIIRYIVLALRGGGILDPSGTIATKTEMMALQEAQKETSRIQETARTNLLELAKTIDGTKFSTNEISTAFVFADWPRMIPGENVSTNLSGVIEKMENVDGGTNLNVYVYFSQAIASAPTLSWQVQISETDYVQMATVSNSYPATVEVREGVRCYVYKVSVPEALRGYVMRPGYELEFGGPNAEEYFGVSSYGISVTDGSGVEHLPVYGKRSVTIGGETLELGIDGGVVTCAKWRGEYWWGNGEHGVSNNIPDFVVSALGGLE